MENFWGMEFDWFALDSAGNIGIFSFGGYGFIPEEVLAHHASHSHLADVIPLPHLGSLQIWQDFAEAGLFVYDWNEYKGPYLRKAEPTKPIDAALKDRILQIEGLPILRHNFRDRAAVSITDLKPISMQKTALLAGATGLIGSQLLPLLLASDRYAKVIVVGRRAVPTIHPKLVQVVTEFDQLEAVRLKLIADDVFCCLGTTMALAGSKEAFYKVDFLYVVQLAALAASNFAAQLLVVSSMGADAESRIYYSRVKGEMEAAVRQTPFRAIHIFRPSLLLGERAAPRLGERLGALALRGLRPLLRGPLLKYRAVSGAAVAAAMLRAAEDDGGGVRVHESAELQD